MRNVLEGSNIARGRKNRRNIRKHVIRKPATLAQTIRRRILLTGGSVVVSTIFGLAGGTFAAAGNGGLTGAGEDGGAPAATVSPGAAGCGLFFADDSSLAEVSTSEPLRRLNYTLQRCIRVKD